MHGYDRVIQFVIDQAKDKDVVILAGKGHEAYQIFATETIYFDDREKAMKALSIRSKVAVLEYDLRI